MLKRQTYRGLTPINETCFWPEKASWLRCLGSRTVESCKGAGGPMQAGAGLGCAVSSHSLSLEFGHLSTVFCPSPPFSSPFISNHYLGNNSYLAWRISPTSPINLFLSLSLPRVGEELLGLAAVSPSLWAHCPICTAYTGAVTGGFTQTGSQGNSNIPLDLAVKLYL